MNPQKDEISRFLDSWVMEKLKNIVEAECTEILRRKAAGLAIGIMSANTRITLEVHGALKSQIENVKKFSNWHPTYRSGDLVKFQFCLPPLITPQLAEYWYKFGPSISTKDVREKAYIVDPSVTDRKTIISYPEHTYPTKEIRKLPHQLIHRTDLKNVELPNTYYAREALRLNRLELCLASQVSEKPDLIDEEGWLRVHPEAKLLNTNLMYKDTIFSGDKHANSGLANMIKEVWKKNPNSFESFWEHLTQDPV